MDDRINRHIGGSHYRYTTSVFVCRSRTCEMWYFSSAVFFMHRLHNLWCFLLKKVHITSYKIVLWSIESFLKCELRNRRVYKFDLDLHLFCMETWWWLHLYTSTLLDFQNSPMYYGTPRCLSRRAFPELFVLSPTARSLTSVRRVHAR
jgi:hypothetical protein